jgi:hypothetical protein
MKVKIQDEENFEPSTICRQLKLPAEDGKMRETDCADIEGIFRKYITQSAYNLLIFPGNFYFPSGVTTLPWFLRK